jgi:uncharacterized protein
LPDDSYPLEKTGSRQPNTDLRPVTHDQRLNSIDTLRGIAVLAILVINIGAFAYPDSAMFDPTIIGGMIGLNLLAWKVSYLLFLQKAYALFAMLFGAGVVLMYLRAEKSGRKFGRTYYLRLLWLFIFGMLHGYFLWFGDILVAYAMCGLLLWPVRRWKPRTLLIVGAFIYLLGVPIQYGAGAALNWLRNTAAEVEAADAAGEAVEQYQREMAQVWEEIDLFYAPSAEEMQRQVDIHHGNYTDIFHHRAPITLMLQTQAFIGMILWRTLGLMMIGMALMKFRFFAAQLSLRFYSIFGATCYLVGLLLVGNGINLLLANDFEAISKLTGDGLFNYVGSILVALGHASVVMICCKLGLMSWLKDRLAAVGRMAFSNYIMHTVVFTTIFYGYGLGLYAEIDRFPLWGFVLAMWVAQIWLSSIWLRHFRSGPLEWLWRSLTYRHWQPLRIRS